MFAKIFESAKYGQILVHKDQGDDGGILCFRLNLKNGMFLNITSEFQDSEDGWDLLDEAFESATLEASEAHISKNVKDHPLASLFEL